MRMNDYFFLGYSAVKVRAQQPPMHSRHGGGDWVLDGLSDCLCRHKPETSSTLVRGRATRICA